MSKKTIKKESNKTILARVTEEMAEPRMAKSARDEDAKRIIVKESAQVQSRQKKPSA